MHPYNQYLITAGHKFISVREKGKSNDMGLKRSPEESYKDRLRKNLRIAIMAVIAGWILLPVVLLWIYGQVDNAGSFGDTFGVVNALFSALAFAFLIYTSAMQREELELQRQELADTRKELEKSAIAQAALVQLAMDQLSLDRFLNKDKIWPEYQPYQVILDDGNQLEVTLILRNFPCKIIGLDNIKNPWGLAILDPNYVGKSLYRRMVPGDTFKFRLGNTKVIELPKVNYHFKVTFLDDDGQTYQQNISIEGTKLSHYKPTKIQ